MYSYLRLNLQEILILRKNRNMYDLSNVTEQSDPKYINLGGIIFVLFSTNEIEII